MLHALAAAALDPRRLVAARRARRRRARRSPPRRDALLARCRTRTGTSATAARRPTTARARLRHRRTAVGAVLADLGLPRDADAYLCGPAAFMAEISAALAAAGHRPGPDPHRDVRRAGARSTPGIAAAPPGRRIRPPGPPGPGPVVDVRAQRPDRPLGRRLRAACSSWPKPATCRCAGHAGPASATPARAACCPATSATPPTRWSPRRGQRADLLLPAPRRPGPGPVISAPRHRGAFSCG